MSGESYDETAVVLAAYGTLRSKVTYDRMVKAYEEAFPGARICLTFTSRQIRRRIFKEEEVFVPNPFTALAELQDEGYEKVVVQSLHVVPGGEFHQLAALVAGLKGLEGRFGFRGLALGGPLLFGARDYEAVSSALASQINAGCPGDGREKGPGEPEIRDEEDVAVVFMGHGTDHPSDSCYSVMARVLKRDHKNVFLGTMEGSLQLEDVIQALRLSGVARVRLMPFLLVAGGHAADDMAGGAGSWRSVLEDEGLEVEVCRLGLGDNEAVLGIFIEHTLWALDALR